MQIQGTSQVHQAQKINAPHFTPKAQGAQAASASRSADRVEISAAANAAASAAETAGIRQDLVNSIRSQIAAGTYDTPEKMGMAVDRLLDQMG